MHGLRLTFATSDIDTQARSRRSEALSGGIDALLQLLPTGNHLQITNGCDQEELTQLLLRRER